MRLLTLVTAPSLETSPFQLVMLRSAALHQQLVALGKKPQYSSATPAHALLKKVPLIPLKVVRGGCPYAIILEGSTDGMAVLKGLSQPRLWVLLVNHVYYVPRWLNKQRSPTVMLIPHA